jgi:hypothetical protein
MAYAMQAPELHVMRTLHIWHKLRNCTSYWYGICAAGSRTACNKAVSYACPSPRTTYDEGMVHVMVAPWFRAMWPIRLIMQCIMESYKIV